MTSERDRLVARAYDETASLYAELFVGDLDAFPDDAARIDGLAERADGALVLDIGCGPGHVTDRMDRVGATAVGVDRAPGMLLEGAARFPNVRLAVADMAALPVATGAAAAAVTRYSTIHTPVDELAPIHAELARVLRPGGELLMFFHGAGADEHGQTYEHRVARVHLASPDIVAESLRWLGFHDIEAWGRPPGPGERVMQAGVTATR